MIMTISQELIDFRTDNSVNISQLPDDVALRYYNDGRDVLIDMIISKKEDFFYNEITSSLVNGQREYRLPKRGDLDGEGNPLGGVIKLKGVSRKFLTTDEYLTKLEPETLANLPFDLGDYEDEENNYKEFYILSDNSIFIYPSPTEDITAGLKMYGIVYPVKLTLSDEETIFSQYKKSILLYVAYRYFISQRLYNEAQNMKNQFDVEVNRIGNTISGRIQSPKQITPPNLETYC